MQDQREALMQLLGGWPAPRPLEQAGQSLSEGGDLSVADGMVVERLQLPCTRRTPHAPEQLLPAILCRPEGKGPFPVVLYCHAHGHNHVIGKEELLSGRPALPEGPYASALVERGMAALAIDLPCFGERQEPGESALSKALLWQGDTLFGTMLRELASAVDYLESREDVDTQRLAVYGISMGATLGWWLAALDDRVKAVAEICCFADLQTLVNQGAHDRHGIYMTVPGLLPRFSTADIASLIVPRAHLCALGELDSLTPPAAIKAAVDPLQRAYEKAGAKDAWQLLIEPDTAHVETAGMRRQVLEFLSRQLLS